MKIDMKSERPIRGSLISSVIVGTLTVGIVLLTTNALAAGGDQDFRARPSDLQAPATPITSGDIFQCDNQEGRAIRTTEEVCTPDSGGNCSGHAIGRLTILLEDAMKEAGLCPGCKEEYQGCAPSVSLVGHDYYYTGQECCVRAGENVWAKCGLCTIWLAP